VRERCGEILRSVRASAFRSTLTSPSPKLEQHPISAARITPLDIAGWLGDHAAGAALDAPVDSYLNLAIVVELVASRGTGFQKCK